LLALSILGNWEHTEAQSFLINCSYMKFTTGGGLELNPCDPGTVFKWHWLWVRPFACTWWPLHWRKKSQHCVDSGTQCLHISAKGCISL
jgi:hypothetical protein